MLAGSNIFGKGVNRESQNVEEESPENNLGIEKLYGHLRYNATSSQMHGRAMPCRPKMIMTGLAKVEMSS